MEVLRHGNTYKKIECKKCGALLSYCEADVKKYSKCEEVFGEWHSYHEESITCPECNDKIMLYIFAD